LARKILLADDSVTAQNMGRKILADAGYEVIAVNNGSAALKKIAELKPDLCILDVYMPGYSGLEVCQRMKESQESSRIPVLLSVGKLEPFKPEEAKRVQADGYIVKPFEASELLSALSKLEDKVVPRAEPSKPGRFARAIAAAEESARSNEKTSEQSGWKSRIAIPAANTEPAQKVVEASQQEKQTKPEAAKASVDVAALAPEGLPTDVTVEEVAAIAAAAAQIQMAEAAASEATAEFQVTTPPNEEVASAASTHTPAPEVQKESAASVAAPAAQDVKVESGSQQVAAEAVEQSDRDEQPQSEPVTMAVAAESVSEQTDKDSGASRWTAVPVALEGEEASLSLEQEMQKVYAAVSTGEAEPSTPAVVEASSAVVENSSEPVQAQAEPVAAVAPVDAAQTVEAEPVVNVEAAQTESEPVAQLGAMPSVEAEASSIQSDVNEKVAPTPAYAESSPAPEFAESEKVMPVAEFLSPVSEAEVAGLAGLVGLSADSQIAAEPEAVTAAPPTATSKPFARIVRTPENGTEPAEQPKPQQEETKHAAAAWSSWRQIRDTGNGAEAATAPAAVEESQSARAVAAGAEQIAQEAESKDNPADVASIVDSVLADLRPKLMAEISRKMAEKK
jgi:CheY-like chemotaxis protein